MLRERKEGEGAADGALFGCARGEMRRAPGLLALLVLLARADQQSLDYCGDAKTLTEAQLLNCNVLCAMPRQPSRHCYIYPHDLMAGGIGAKITSLVQYIEASVESGCTYLHRPLAGLGHNADHNAVERYFNIGEQCVDSEAFLKSISLQEVRLDSKEVRAGARNKPFPPKCTEGQGVLCVLPRVAGTGNIVSARAADTAHRILRARFLKHAKEDPSKHVTWFVPYGGALNGTVTLNVVLHIRRGDVHRDIGKGRYTSDDAITEVLRNLCRALDTIARVRLRGSLAAAIYVASDGAEEDFPGRSWRGLVGATCPARSSLQFRVSATALETFTHFVASDVLLYGVSSFPKLAAMVYHEGVSVAYAKFVRTRKVKNADQLKALGITPPKPNPNPVNIDTLFDVGFQEAVLAHLRRRARMTTTGLGPPPPPEEAAAPVLGQDDDPL
mmetsp:Transcript_26749/g.83792  ORF Transcript_26749/g.83792 Transcript_26749/m.83792 type:complete len:443 (-) Transcript_26749:91-1419(-)